jgi:hypothetical protein
MSGSRQTGTMAVEVVAGKARVAPLFMRVARAARLVFVVSVALVAAPAALAVISDINPNNSTLHASDPDGASGGRINGLSSVAGTNDIFYAATEWGGLYRTNNAGLNWFRLNGHVANVTWDVEVDPSNTQRVYATSFYDGRIATRAGINVSTDGGTTWTRPATATPPAAFNCAAARRTEPSAFGIAIEPGANQNVYIGTNCGLAISTNSGVTWNFVDPTPATAATNVWDVVAQAGGIIDICGDDGHRRTIDGGVNWTVSTGLPTGRCSIAASPDESYVLFVAASDNRFYETDDADAAAPTWVNRGTPEQRAQGRIPFVATNQRPDAGGNNVFDLWFSDVRLYRGDCTTPATRPNPDTGGSPRCPAGRAVPAAPPPADWAGPFTRSAGAHDDAGDIVFDTEGGGDRCPELFSSDGGVYFNTDDGADCQNPNWNQPNVTPHAQWVYAMDGANQAGDANEDLTYGTQDTGSFATTNAGAGSPAWTNRDCCDVFDVTADPTRTVYTVCCFTPAPATQLRFAGSGLTGVTNVATQPPGCCPGFNFVDFIDRYAANSYFAGTPSGGFITTSITANPTVWTQLGAASTPAGGFCGVQASGTTFFAQTQCGSGEGGGASQLWSYQGTAPGGTWQRIDNNDGLTGGFTVWGVDPNNANRIYAANNAAGGMQMVFSTDGGTNWNTDPELDQLMTANGAFRYTTQRGPTSFTGFGGYSQPSLLAYDPENANIIVAGGRDSGVFLSTDSGANWSLLTDPLNSDTSGRPHLPRPMFAYFDHEPADTVGVYIGTQGRGVWRISFKIPTASAGGPYTTAEGTNVTLNAGGSTDPDGQPLTYAWDFDGDGQFDDATGQNPTYDLVGQDGAFTVTVKATDTDGAFDTDTATVTVTNVAPTVNATANDPKPEGSPVTVTGTISDPGWLENLTGTIDWGDGSPVEPVGGSLENVRPNATRSFTIQHTYLDDEPVGEDDLYQAEICGSDDDTTTCFTLDISIFNVPPVLDPVTAPTGPVKINTPFTASASFTDVGILDTHTAVWDWGDGNVETGTVTQGSGSGTVSNSHTYTSSDLYTVTLTVTDDDLGSDTQVFEYIIVFDPARSLASNAKINSPAGAYVPNASKVGLAYSTAGARYKSDDAVIPSGAATFQFSAAPFYFSSGSLDWLVVANGGRGYLQGTGSVNSVPGYTFLLSVVDAQIAGAPAATDSYRIKVWNTATNVVVYDSQFGAPIKTPANIPLLAGSVQLYY